MGKSVLRKKVTDDPVPLFPSYPFTPAPLRLAELLLTFDRVVVSGSPRVANLDRLVKLFSGLAALSMKEWIRPSLHERGRAVTVSFR